MVGACFVKAGTEDSVYLTELKIVGYENNQYYLDNLEFTVSFQRRSSNGMPYAEYAFTDLSDDCAT